MRIVLKVLQIPINHTAVVLVGIFLTPTSFGGGGSPTLLYNVGQYPRLTYDTSITWRVSSWLLGAAL